jgi:transposase
MIKRAFKFKLKPTSLQVGLFLRFAGARRWVFNYGLDQKQKAFEATGKSLSYYDQNKALTTLKETPETSWLVEIHSQVLQQGLKDLDRAFQNFFRRVKLRRKTRLSQIQKERQKRELPLSSRSIRPRLHSLPPQNRLGQIPQIQRDSRNHQRDHHPPRRISLACLILMRMGKTYPCFSSHSRRASCRHRRWA